jgi:hypothetical protein
MSRVIAVTTVQEQVQQWTQEHQDVGQHLQQMESMLGDEIDTSDSKQHQNDLSF